MKRIRVGLVIDVDDAWLGGINYYRTLVSAVYADPERSIDLVLFFGERANPAQLDGFPEVDVVRSPILDRRGTAATWRWRMIKLLGRDVLLQRLLKRHRIDVLSHFGGKSRRGLRCRGHRVDPRLPASAPARPLHRGRAARRAIAPSRPSRPRATS